MTEERIWNIPTSSYDKAGEENYSGNFNFDLYYYIENQ